MLRVVRLAQGLLSEEVLVAGAGMGGRQHADTALDIHLPDEVVVEQAQGWGGR